MGQVAAMTYRSILAMAALTVTLSLTACAAPVVDASPWPQSDATFADYQKLVDASQDVIADARAFVPESSIVRADPSVTDLDDDFHRLDCSDTTSQYTNVINYYLAENSGEVAIIDEIRDTYMADGWQRSDSVAEQLGEEQDPTEGYHQTLRSPDDFVLSINRGDGASGETILQMTVYSPCIGNPTDKPATWGRG